MHLAVCSAAAAIQVMKGCDLIMAFDSLKGERIYVSQSEQMFLVGDYFSVFRNSSEVPLIYEWSEIKGYTENPTSFILVTEDSESYVIPKACFSGATQIIRFRTIAEGQITGAKCRLTQRILPPKYNYSSVDIPEQSFSADCVYNEKDINSGSIAHIHSRTAKYIFLIGGLVFVAVFLLLTFIRGEFASSWFYYLPISIFCGIAAGVAIYLISSVIARLRFADFVKHDVSALENNVIVVAHAGFAAVEKCVYTGMELIPWSQADFFFETKNTIVITCRDRSVCWIPKRIFPKNVQNDLSSFIASRVTAR